MADAATDSDAPVVESAYQVRPNFKNKYVVSDCHRSGGGRWTCEWVGVPALVSRRMRAAVVAAAAMGLGSSRRW